MELMCGKYVFNQSTNKESDLQVAVAKNKIFENYANNEKLVKSIISYHQTYLMYFDRFTKLIESNMIDKNVILSHINDIEIKISTIIIKSLIEYSTHIAISFYFELFVIIYNAFISFIFYNDTNNHCDVFYLFVVRLSIFLVLYMFGVIALYQKIYAKNGETSTINITAFDKFCALLIDVLLLLLLFVTIDIVPFDCFLFNKWNLNEWYVNGTIVITAFLLVIIEKFRKICIKKCAKRNDKIFTNDNYDNIAKKLFLQMQTDFKRDIKELVDSSVGSDEKEISISCKSDTVSKIYEIELESLKKQLIKIKNKHSSLLQHYFVLTYYYFDHKYNIFLSLFALYSVLLLMFRTILQILILSDHDMKISRTTLDWIEYIGYWIIFSLYVLISTIVSLKRARIRSLPLLSMIYYWFKKYFWCVLLSIVLGISIETNLRPISYLTSDSDHDDKNIIYIFNQNINLYIMLTILLFVAILGDIIIVPFLFKIHWACCCLIKNTNKNKYIKMQEYLTEPQIIVQFRKDEKNEKNEKNVAMVDNIYESAVEQLQEIKVENPNPNVNAIANYNVDDKKTHRMNNPFELNLSKKKTKSDHELAMTEIQNGTSRKRTFSNVIVTEIETQNIELKSDSEMSPTARMINNIQFQRTTNDDFRNQQMAICSNCKKFKTVSSYIALDNVLLCQDCVCVLDS